MLSLFLACSILVYARRLTAFFLQVSWLHEAAVHGYEFWVHTGVFAVHMPESALLDCDPSK